MAKGGKGVMNRAVRIAASLAVAACAWNVHAQVMQPSSPSGTTPSVNPEFTWSGTWMGGAPLPPAALSYNVLVQNTAGVAIYENVAVKSRCFSGGFTGMTFSSCSVIFDTPLANGATYNWFIQPVTASGPGAWAGPLAFTVNQSTAVPGAVTIVSPAPGSTAASMMVDFAWTPATGATAYRLYVWDALGELLGVNEVPSTSCAAQCTARLGVPSGDNTPYTWRVTPFNAGGNGPTSGPLSFTVRSIPAPPSWYTPADTRLQPTYRWFAGAGATSYSLQVNGPQGVVFAETYSAAAVGCVTNNFCTITPPYGLESGAFYNAWVGSINSIGQSDLALLAFTTQAATPLPPPPPVAPEAPSMFEPGTGSSALFPSFRWSKVANATMYTLLVQNTQGVAINETFDADDVCPSTGTECFLAAASTPLVSGQYYMAFLNASNAYGTSPWSFSRQIRVDLNGAPPAAPVRIAPNGTVTTATPAYSWNAVAGAISYHLLVQNTAGIAVDVRVTASEAGCASASVCSFIPSTPLAVGNTYSWFVQATNIYTTGNWSEMGTITVSVTAPSLPPAPVIVAPIGQTPFPMPIYSWNAIAGVATYELLVQNTAGVAVNVTYAASAAGCGAGTGTCSAQPSNALTLGNTYSWFVRATNGAGIGPWSAPTTVFPTASIIPAPGPPVVISPSGVVTTPTPTFAWNAMGGVASYYLLVQNTSGVAVGMTVPAAAAGCGTGTGVCSIVAPTALANGATYNWFVNATNPVGTGPWSATTTISISSVGPSVPLPPVILSISASPTFYTPLVSWSASDGATSYELIAQNTQGVAVSVSYPASAVGCAAGGTCSIAPTTPASTCTAPGFGTCHPLLPSTRYMWFIKASNELGASDWSAGREQLTP